MKIYLLSISIDNNTYLMMTSKPQIFARGRRSSVFSQGVAPIPGVSPVAIQRTQLELGLSGLWWRLTQASEIDFRHGKLAFIGQMTFVVIPLVRAKWGGFPINEKYSLLCWNHIYSTNLVKIGKLKEKRQKFRKINFSFLCEINCTKITFFYLIIRKPTY